MKCFLLVSGIAVLILLTVGGTVFWWFHNKAREMTTAIQAASFDFTTALAGSMQEVEVEPRFELDGLTTKAHLRIKNSGKASCEYKILEYKLADQPPREAIMPFKVARLDPGEIKEVATDFRERSLGMDRSGGECCRIPEKLVANLTTEGRPAGPKAVGQLECGKLSIGPGEARRGRVQEGPTDSQRAVPKVHAVRQR